VSGGETKTDVKFLWGKMRYKTATWEIKSREGNETVLMKTTLWFELKCVRTGYE
jgi:hypothetical protein